MFCIRSDKMIEVFCCTSAICPKKESCFRQKSKFLSIIDAKFETLIDEDYFNICHGERLYSKSFKKHKNEPAEYLKEIFNFQDNICDPKDCAFCHPYPENEKYRSSRIECIQGDNFTCKHPEQPINKALSENLACIKLLHQALDKLGRTDGQVEFECPSCGGTILGVKSGEFITCKCTSCDMNLMV